MAFRSWRSRDVGLTGMDERIRRGLLQSMLCALDATGERWACLPGQEVELYTLDGKGHSWPGSMMPARITSQDVDATAVMWAFFKADPRP
jgi:poly(3-hydroxybutyrate) depolymerase